MTLRTGLNKYYTWIVERRVENFYFTTRLENYDQHYVTRKCD